MTNILVVDQSPRVFQVITAATRGQAKCVYAESEAEAFQLLAAERPDVAFVTDWRNNADRFSLVREIRANPANASLYIVQTTIEHNLLSWTHHLRHGVDRMLLKPFHASDIVTILQARRQILALTGKAA